MTRLRDHRRPRSNCAPRSGRARSWVTRLASLLGALLFAVTAFFPTWARAEIELPQIDQRKPFTFTAAKASRWQEGAYEVWLLEGGAQITQGGVTAKANEALLWIDRADPLSSNPHKIIAYLEGSVRLDYGRTGEPHTSTGNAAQSLTSSSWLGRFFTTADINIKTPLAQPEPAVKPPVYRRAMQARAPERVAPVQFQEPVAPPEAPASGPVVPGFRRIYVRPRSAVPIQARWFPSPSGHERIAVIDSGVNIVVEGIDKVGTLDISADRIVVWTGELAGESLAAGNTQNTNTPLEFYLEGNIIFRQGDRVLYADRMFYNVNHEQGLVLNAEMLTPVPDYQGLLRLKADVIRQLDRQHFEAHEAAVTSSRLGVPRYWIQSETLNFTDEQRVVNEPFSTSPAIDPTTGEQAVEHSLLASSRNNFVYLGGVPVFYWPTIATDLTQPTFYVEGFSLKHDRVFGSQILVDWNMYQLLGWKHPPENTSWQLSTDYLSERGPALGTKVTYQFDQLFGIAGPTYGFFDAWGIVDTGLDDLGADRRALTHPTDNRYRILGRHRQRFGDGYQITSETGKVSDGNFLEQFYEQEWDELKDQTSGYELKRLNENTSWSLAADMQVNTFFTQTSDARFDHFWIGQDLPFGLTWSEHSHVGFFKIGTADVPFDPTDASKFNPLLWEPLDSPQNSNPIIPGDREGIRAATRQELDRPFDLGPVKFVPYVLGELAYWGEDLNGESVTRTYGQAGMRASIPMWRADPAVQSLLLNVNGLAHKVTFEADAFWAEANQDIGRFTLYDPLDDDNVEHFRRRFVDDTFGGVLNFPDANVVPPQFDERNYAIRNRLGSWVASPNTEVVEDLQVIDLGINQRWQTKRGLPGQERIIDWVTFDVGASLFPNADRDDFGEVMGAVNYDFTWHVGDRLALLSDGYFDFFDNGLKVVTVGAFLDRPERLNAYVGLRSIEGPVTSNILGASIGYRLSDKWILSASGSYDLASVGNIGQNVRLVRVGESFLVGLGLNIDTSRDNVGLSFSIEPRFLPKSKLGRVGGVNIPPAGAFGLE